MKLSTLFLLLLFGTTLLQALTHVEYLEKYCYKCHDEDVQKGELRLDNLGTDLTDLNNFRIWSDVYRRVKQGDMPPKKKPAVGISNTFAAELHGKLHDTEKERINRDGRVAWRRLTVKEYNNTLKQLLHHPDLNISNRLPQDTPLKHFDKEDHSLNLVREHMDAYFNIANFALKGSYQPALKDPDMSPYTGHVRVHANLIQRRGQTYWDMDQQRKLFAPVEAKYPGISKLYNNKRKELGVYSSKRKEQEMHQTNQELKTLHDTYSEYYKEKLKAAENLTVFVHGVSPITIKQTPFSGLYDIKVRLRAVRKKIGDIDSQTLPVGVHFSFGGSKRTIEVPLGGWREFTLKNVFMMKQSRMNFDLDENARRTAGKARMFAPAIVVDYVEVRPKKQVNDRHDVLWGGLEHETIKDMDKLQLDTAVMTKLQSFTLKAFRRPVKSEQLDIYFSFYKNCRLKGDSFQNALLKSYKCILTSPSFLYKKEHRRVLDSSTLASRLSYFLWNSMPDDYLYNL
ncbi:MAG: DUF1595 domain-containing protein, partial [Lentisphaeraceae bacterium]|nr:DUF1595 domain-containing protein [Lentisphaeraceae bacterium]